MQKIESMRTYFIDGLDDVLEVVVHVFDKYAVDLIPKASIIFRSEEKFIDRTPVFEMMGSNTIKPSRTTGRRFSGKACRQIGRPSSKKLALTDATCSGAVR